MSSSTVRTDGARRRCALRSVGLFACVVALGPTGCGLIGAASLSGSRERYHDAIRRTGEEQMLLNLVRLQYDDLPFFLQVTTVTSQLTAGLMLSVGPKITTSAAELGGTLNGTIQESPSITYQPLLGEDFVNALLRRIPENSLVMLLRSNWRVSMVVKLFVHELGRLHNLNVKAPTSPEIWAQYAKLKETLELLDDLTDRGVVDFDSEPIPLQVYTDVKTRAAVPKESPARSAPNSQSSAPNSQSSAPNSQGSAKTSDPPPTDPSPSPPPAPPADADKPDKNDTTAAHWEENPHWPVLRLRQPADMTARDRDEWEQVLRELGVCHSTGSSSLGPIARHCSGGRDSTAFYLLPSHLRDERFARIDYIPITMRSILEVMMTVSGGVSVPEGSAHRMPTATCGDSTPNVEKMNELFHVYCSSQAPHDVAVRVHYGDKWFYIKKEDYQSRQVFSMVLLMFQEQIPKTVTPAGPILTLPVNR